MPSGGKIAAARRNGLDAANGEKSDSKFQIQNSRGNTFQWARLKCETAIITRSQAKQRDHDAKQPSGYKTPRMPRTALQRIERAAMGNGAETHPAFKHTRKTKQCTKAAASSVQLVDVFAGAAARCVRLRRIRVVTVQRREKPRCAASQTRRRAATSHKTTAPKARRAMTRGVND